MNKHSVLALLVAALFSSVAFAGVAPQVANPEMVISYEVGGMSYIPAPSCQKNEHGFVDVDTGSPSPNWPVQIQVTGSGPWLVRLSDAQGREDMTTTANVNVFCVPNR